MLRNLIKAISIGAEAANETRAFAQRVQMNQHMGELTAIPTRWDWVKTFIHEALSHLRNVRSHHLITKAHLDTCSTAQMFIKLHYCKHGAFDSPAKATVIHEMTKTIRQIDLARQLTSNGWIDDQLAMVHDGLATNMTRIETDMPFDLVAGSLVAVCERLGHARRIGAHDLRQA
jgi:hypothetical protein